LQDDVALVHACINILPHCREYRMQRQCLAAPAGGHTVCSANREKRMLTHQQSDHTRFMHVDKQIAYLSMVMPAGANGGIGRSASAKAVLPRQDAQHILQTTNRYKQGAFTALCWGGLVRVLSLSTLYCALHVNAHGMYSCIDESLSVYIRLAASRASSHGCHISCNLNAGGSMSATRYVQPHLQMHTPSCRQSAASSSIESSQTQRCGARICRVTPMLQCVAPPFYTQCKLH